MHFWYIILIPMRSRITESKCWVDILACKAASCVAALWLKISRMRAVRSHTRTSPPRAFSKLRSCLEVKIPNVTRIKATMNNKCIGTTLVYRMIWNKSTHEKEKNQKKAKKDCYLKICIGVFISYISHALHNQSCL